MKLAKYLAGYLRTEFERGERADIFDEEIIQNGLEVFASTENVQVLVAAGNDSNIVERIV